jgi:DHA2 family multidrug resistance protein
VVSLGATLTDVAWVITAYAIANVIVIPTSYFTTICRRNYFATLLSYLPLPHFYVVMPQIYGISRISFHTRSWRRCVIAQTIITESYPIAKRGNGTSNYGMGVINPL